MCVYSNRVHMACIILIQVNEFIWHQGMVGPVRIPEASECLCASAREHMLVHTYTGACGAIL